MHTDPHRYKTEFTLSCWRWSAEFNTWLDRATETLTVAWFALCAEAGRWWEFNRVCAWCGCRLGGNPFARKTSHGICRYCRATSWKIEEGRAQSAAQPSPLSTLPTSLDKP